MNQNLYKGFSASLSEKKRLAEPGSVKVSLGEDQISSSNINFSLWKETFTCETGSIVYRKGHVFSLIFILNSYKRSIRFLDIDTLNGHLNTISSNRDFINTKLNVSSNIDKTKFYYENAIDNVHVSYGDFMQSRFHALTSLPSQKSVVSNFGQYNYQMFWQMTTDSSFTIEYDRVEMKPLQHQWNQLLGPISLSGVDMFKFQYDCIKGN